MNGPADRLERARHITLPPDAPVGQRQFAQPLTVPYPIDVIIRVADLDANRLLVQRVDYLELPPVEGNTHALGPFLEVHPPPCATYGSVAWAVYPLIGIDDVVYDHNPEPVEEGEDESVTEYRQGFNAALALEAEVLPDGQVTRLGISAYPVEMTWNGRYLTLRVPLWMEEDVAFMDDEVETEERTEGMDGG